MRAKTDCHTKCMYTLLKNIHGHEHARTQKNVKLSTVNQKGTCVHGIEECTHWQAHSSVKQIWDKKQYMHNNLI